MTSTTTTTCLAARESTKFGNSPNPGKVAGGSSSRSSELGGPAQQPTVSATNSTLGNVPARSNPHAKDSGVDPIDDIPQNTNRNHPVDHNVINDKKREKSSYSRNAPGSGKEKEHDKPHPPRGSDKDKGGGKSSKQKKHQWVPKKGPSASKAAAVLDEVANTLAEAQGGADALRSRVCELNEDKIELKEKLEIVSKAVVVSAQEHMAVAAAIKKNNKEYDITGKLLGEDIVVPDGVVSVGDDLLCGALPEPTQYLFSDLCLSVKNIFAVAFTEIVEETTQALCEWEEEIAIPVYVAVNSIKVALRRADDLVLDERRNVDHTIHKATDRIINALSKNNVDGPGFDYDGILGPTSFCGPAITYSTDPPRKVVLAETALLCLTVADAGTRYVAASVIYHGLAFVEAFTNEIFLSSSRMVLESSAKMTMDVSAIVFSKLGPVVTDAVDLALSYPKLAYTAERAEWRYKVDRVETNATDCRDTAARKYTGMQASVDLVGRYYVRVYHASTMLYSGTPEFYTDTPVAPSVTNTLNTYMHLGVRLFALSSRVSLNALQAFNSSSILYSDADRPAAKKMYQNILRGNLSLVPKAIELLHGRGDSNSNAADMIDSHRTGAVQAPALGPAGPNSLK